MWQPKNEYHNKTKWTDHEDKALILSWGLTTIEEICEGFMCHPINIISRARLLGIMPYGYAMLSAEHIEKIIQLISIGTSLNDIAEMFHLPDNHNTFHVPPHNALSDSRREIEDYYSQNNENQSDLFGDDDTCN